jgi:hypothetical protein
MISAHSVSRDYFTPHYPLPPSIDPNAPTAAPSSNESIAFLNVHSGLSMGLMAGLDVGAFDRWEYLLLGQPVRDVARAEAEAKKGELVISDLAHSILHPNSTIPPTFALDLMLVCLPHLFSSMCVILTFFLY